MKPTTKVTAPTDAAKLTGIRAVILDYGEVLCLLPTPAALARMARIFRIEPNAFLPIYTESRPPYDRGDLLPAEYWHAFAAQAGVKIDEPTIEQIRRWDVEMWSRMNDPMIRWLERLHAGGMKTAILSNMPLDMVAHVRQNFPWIKFFDHQIFSAEVRRVKPEPAIYQHSIETVNVPASEILFIDDRDVNLEKARAVGLHCIRFVSASQLRDELETRDFAILPPRTESQGAR